MLRIGYYIDSKSSKYNIYYHNGKDLYKVFNIDGWYWIVCNDIGEIDWSKMSYYKKKPPLPYPNHWE